MGLNVEQMHYEVLYRFLDERESYFAHGVWYVRKYNNSKSFQKPIMYIYHFDLNGKVVAIYCGNLIDYNYQNGVEFSIKGWKIDKESSIDDVGSQDTINEYTFSVMNLTTLSSPESEMVNDEILHFLEDPTAYLDTSNNKTSK